MCTAVTWFLHPVLRGPVWGGGAEKGAGAWGLAREQAERGERAGSSGASDGVLRDSVFVLEGTVAGAGVREV